MQNLRDKLLKAGLVSAEQTKAAEESLLRKKERPKPEERRPPPRPSAPPPRSAPRPPPPPRAPVLPPPEPGSKAWHRLASLERTEEDRRIRLLVLAAEVPLEIGSHPFHFLTRQGKLRRLVMTVAQAKRLEESELAVVERPEAHGIEHSLVPREIAEKLLVLREKAVRFYNRSGQPIGFLTDEALTADVSTEPETEDVPAPPVDG
jgi:hypothetical protein